jgi:hypothetical protein
MSSLPQRPNYEQLRKQAKDLHKACMAGDKTARQRLRTHHPNSNDLSPSSAVTLAQAQLAIARQYGFGSWPRLKRSLDDIAAVEAEITQLCTDFANTDEAGRQKLLEAVPDRRRFVTYKDGDTRLADTDARLMVANRRNYALWSKFDSYVYLDPAVKDVITAVRQGDLDGLRKILAEAPEAASPRWVAGYQARESDLHPDIPNDSIPLFCVSEAIFCGTNKKGNEGELARILLQAGADPDLCWKPMEGAVSFNCPRVLEALIEYKANIEGPAFGVFMAYPMLFGFTEICQILAQAGAQLDLRFAAGLGQLDTMESWIDEQGKLLPDPGLADPYMQSQATLGQSAVRVQRDDSVVLGQALLYACLHNHRQAAAWLLEHGAQVNALVRGTDCDTTTLHRLVSYCHGETSTPSQVGRDRLPMLEWLLAQGADPTLPDASHGGGAMHWAVHANMIHDMARRMVATLPHEHFADDGKDEGESDRILRHMRGEELVKTDNIAAVLAYFSNNTDAGGVLLRYTGFCPDTDGSLAAALIEAGVDPNGTADSDKRLVGGGSSHLHTACSFNAVGVARVLLEHGADPNSSQGDLFHGGTPLGFATFFGFPRLVDLLLEYGGTPYNLAMAAASGHLDTVRAYFLADGSLRQDANATSLHQVPDHPTCDKTKTVAEAQTIIQKAFQVAVLHGRTDIVRFFLDKGVEVNGTTNIEYHGAEWAYLDEPEWAHLAKDAHMSNIWGTMLKHAVARRYEKIAVLLSQQGGTMVKPG